MNVGRHCRALEIKACLALAMAAVAAVWVFLPWPMVISMLFAMAATIPLALLLHGRARAMALGAAAASMLLLAGEAFCIITAGPGWPPAAPLWLPLSPLPLAQTVALLPRDVRGIHPVQSYSSHRVFVVGNLTKLDPRIGWCYRPHAYAREFHFSREHLVCDATYSTDAHGMRTTTKSSQTSPDAMKILFFGDSFTFGACLNDEHTIASVLQSQVGPRFRVCNLAVSGGGPQNMVAMLESKFLRDMGIHEHVALAFFGTIRHHLWRVRGEVAWRTALPRYVLRDGLLVRAGLFPVDERYRYPVSTDSSYAREISLIEIAPFWLSYFALKSALVDRLSSSILGPFDGTDLFIKHILRARDLLRKQYDADLVVFFWDDFGRSQEYVNGALRRNHVRFFEAGQVMPGFSPETHNLPFFDHPNARASREAAVFLAKQIDGLTFKGSKAPAPVFRPTPESAQSRAAGPK